MEVANLELCKVLYELSGWEPEPPCWKLPDATFNSRVPSYTLGYLLRKLPPLTKLETFSDPAYEVEWHNTDERVQRGTFYQVDKTPKMPPVSSPLSCSNKVC